MEPKDSKSSGTSLNSGNNTNRDDRWVDGLAATSTEEFLARILGPVTSAPHTLQYNATIALGTRIDTNTNMDTPVNIEPTRQLVANPVTALLEVKSEEGAKNSISAPSAYK